MVKIQFENKDGIYLVIPKKSDDQMAPIGMVVNELIRPILRAAGYSQKVVDEYVPLDEESLLNDF